MKKYIQLAKDLGMANAVRITPKDIVFDVRSILKCRWGCEDVSEKNLRCHHRDTTLDERMAMLKKYKNILLVHAHDAQALSKALLEIERAAFLDGHYFAFALRFCRLCKICKVEQGKDCPTPRRIRPCEISFGIDVYKTVRNLKLPCDPLPNKDALENRYGFLLVD